MKKRILSLLLILCMTVSLLPTAAFAAESADGEAASPLTSVEKDSGPVHVKKSVSTGGDKTKLTLEAYLTNEVTQTVSARPLDIVLVLDQSGSMAYNFNGVPTQESTARRQYAMKQAVNAFIAKVGEQYSEQGDHRMAIVTFGSGATQLVGWTAVDASGEPALTNAINQLPQEPSGATNVGAGMQKAQELMNSAQTGVGRQKVVIVFTDGIPTTTNEFDTGVATTAIKAAKAMKDAGATIYTVGIFNGANPSEMYGATGFDTNSDGTVNSKWEEDNWGLFPNTDFPEADRPAGNRFLNLVSSNYPNADSIGLERETYGLGILHSGISYTVTKNFDRAAEGSYYLTADSSSGLNGIFQQIIEEISTLEIVAGTNAVLSDTLSEHFALDIPEGVEAADAITAEKWVCTGKDETGSYTWEKAAVQPAMTIDVTGKTIKVTGFDYTENAVTATTADGATVYSGAKLVVTIPIQPDAACTAWQAGELAYPTNSTAAGSKAGLSNYTDKAGNAAEPTLLDQSPEASVTAYSVTYTDGVDGEEIFADQVSVVLPGTATPAFNGTPSREGYTFAGWSPAAADTVTENVTYTAQWEKQAPPEAKYTVRYDWGTDAPDDKALPVDRNEYSSEEAARAAMDTEFTSASTSDAPRGGKAGTWKFSGWDEGKLEGTVVTFTGHWTFEAKETGPVWDWDVSKSKTATPLDTNNWTSDVTLSLPSAEEKLATDVVFVLDTSDCVGNVMDQVSKLVAKLETAQKDTGANIKVGVVAFKGSALPMFDGTLVSVEEAKTTLDKMAAEVSKAKDKEAVVLGYLNADGNFINKGSNLHSGLLGAQALLKADSAVDNNRKYVITVTDGMTYYWNDNEGSVYGIYSGSSSNGASYPSLLFYAWCEAHNIPMSGENPDNLPLYGLPTDFTGWDAYLAEARALEDQDNGKYKVDLRQMKKTLGGNFGSIRFSTIDALNSHEIPYIPVEEESKHAHGMDYSVTACLGTYQEMVKAGYQCYTLNPDYGTNTFPGLFTSKLNEMAHKTVVDFNSIQNDILYAVGAGSTVVDKMGSEFDFVPGSLKLTVGGKELAAKTVGNVTYFGDDAKDLSESKYRFKVAYDKDNDMFTWTINENVSNFAPVQLTYTVKLVNPRTAAGTYKVPTNEYATLTPVDSSGNQGKELTFPIPEVSYTVKQHYTPTTVTKPALNTDDHYAYVMGYPDGTVQPGGYITRAEASTIFFRLLTDETREQYWATTNAYSDIKGGDWYNNAVSTLSNAGIVSGYPDGTFRPNAPITRAEMSKIIALFAKLDKTTDRFTDIAGHWAEAYIKLAAGNGWIEGYPDGSFRPNQSITRAETVTMINRVLERVPSKEDHLLSEYIMLTFPDCKSGDWFYIAIQEATNSHTYERAATEKNGDEQWIALRTNRDWTLLEK